MPPRVNLVVSFEKNILNFFQPFFSIAETCADEIVQLLQGAGGHPPVDINARNAYDRTALHWAAGNNNTHALRVLIQMGASVDAKVGLNIFKNFLKLIFQGQIRHECTPLVGMVWALSIIVTLDQGRRQYKEYEQKRVDLSALCRDPRSRADY